MTKTNAAIIAKVIREPAVMVKAKSQLITGNILHLHTVKLLFLHIRDAHKAENNYCSVYVVHPQSPLLALACSIFANQDRMASYLDNGISLTAETL